MLQPIKIYQRNLVDLVRYLMIFYILILSDIKVGMMDEKFLAPDFDNIETYEFAATRGDKDKRLDVFLSEKMKRYSRTFLSKLIKSGSITVTGGKAKAGYKLKGNEKIKIDVPLLIPTSLKPFDYPLDIIFEDEFIIAVNKPACMTTHPANQHQQDTLANALVAYTNKLSALQENPLKLGIVHRLDRETSGVILAAKDEWAHFKLAEQFQNRTIEKEYRAIVHGEYPYDEDVIDLPIARHLRHSEMMTVSPTGREALTKFKVIERFQEFSYLACFPKSGRTHQIRVHLSHRVFPLAGDKL